MIEPLLKIRKGITRLLELALISAVALLVVDVVWGVFTRKVLGAQADFTEELAKILLIWVALLGSALAFETKGHLGVDFFVNLFAPQARKLMAVTVHIVVLAFTIIIFLAGGIRVVSDQLLMEQLTPALHKAVLKELEEVMAVYDGRVCDISADGNNGSCST